MTRSAPHVIGGKVEEELSDGVMEVLLKDLSGPRDAVVEGGRSDINQSLLDSSENLCLIGGREGLIIEGGGGRG